MLQQAELARLKREKAALKKAAALLNCRTVSRSTLRDATPQRRQGMFLWLPEQLMALIPNKKIIPKQGNGMSDLMAVLLSSFSYATVGLRLGEGVSNKYLLAS